MENNNALNSSENGQVSTNTMKVKPRNVYIWDMDETLILLKSLLDGTYAGSFHGAKDYRKGVEIGKKWENIILRVCDEHFYYEEIENYNEPFLDSISEYDDGRDLTNYDFESDCIASPYDNSNKRKLAYRHRSIGEKYRKGLNVLLDQQMIKLWNELYGLTDSYTDGWLSSAHELVKQALNNESSKYENVNVLVTSGSLIPSLAKCLVYKLDDVISHDNIYSSWEVGKLQCFNWIKERFDGPKVQFCVIGDGNEECNAAQTMKFPFIKIEFRPNSPNRFPGLNLNTIKSYTEVVYGPMQAQENEEADDG